MHVPIGPKYSLTEGKAEGPTTGRNAGTERDRLECKPIESTCEAFG